MTKGLRLVALGLAMVGVGTGCTRNDLTPHLIRTQYGAFDPASDSLPDFSRALTARKDAPIARIVQFEGHVRATWRASVARSGAIVRGYMPEDALIVMATSEQVANIQALPFVRSVTEQPRAFKVDRRLVSIDERGAHLFSMRPQEELLVALASPEARANVASVVQAAGGALVVTRATRANPKVLRVRMPIAGVDALSAMADVLSVEMYFAPKLLNDISYGVVQAGTLSKSPLWDRGLRGLGQIIGVADTGLFTASCFFNTGDKVVQYQDLAGTGDGDGHGHGTHVAGSIAGDNYGNGKYDTHDGMAPAARLLIQDVADGGDLIGLGEDLEPMFEEAYLAGARIHSDSWGDEDNTYSIIARQVDHFAYTHPDFLMLFANGNSGDYGPMTVGSPATAKNIISVGALNGAYMEDMAWFSSKGPTADGRIKPTLSAPGVGVVSAKSSGACDTRSMSGTSMATPTLAGAAALVRQYFTDGYYPSGRATPANAVRPSSALLKAVMLAGADDMAGIETNGHMPSQGQGFGRAHLANGLSFAGDRRTFKVEDSLTGLETGESVDFAIQVKQGQNVRVALTWTDPPAEASVEQALVNNLDLTVVGPDGSYHGNILTDGASTLRDGADDVNVEEVVSVPNAPGGTYHVIVRGTNVPMGPQPFAVATVAKFWM